MNSARGVWLDLVDIASERLSSQNCNSLGPPVALRSGVHQNAIHDALDRFPTWNSTRNAQAATRNSLYD